MWFDLLAQLAHEDAQIVRVVHVDRAPHFLKQMLVGDHIAGVLGDYVVENVPLSELKAFTPKVEGVDAAAVQRVAQRLLDPTNASVIVVGDAKLFLDDLRKKYPNVEVIPADKVNLDSVSLK